MTPDLTRCWDLRNAKEESVKGTCVSEHLLVEVFFYLLARQVVTIIYSKEACPFPQVSSTLGRSQAGKAQGFDSCMLWFESRRPNHFNALVVKLVDMLFSDGSAFGIWVRISSRAPLDADIVQR